MAANRVCSFFEHLGLIAALVLVTVLGDVQRGDARSRA
ncbi:hypothetical protein BURMUCF2_B0559 [Burkholderia multivorans CF2]|nr:hypothetical protein BURMUCF2_B0559 [Burkholderia multivorans CF2]